MIAGVSRTTPPPAADKLCNIVRCWKRAKLKVIAFQFPTLSDRSLAMNRHLSFSGRIGIQLSQKLTHDIDLI